MTHLLATLLTGGRFTTMNSGSAPESSGEVSGSSFDQMMRDRTETVAENRGHEAEADNREGGRTDSRHPEPVQGGQGGPEGETPTSESLASRVTLLGVRVGAGVRVPSLTFMLPEGSGPADLAAAVRTQVLRQVANRQLDPGSLDNLRLAISSRELGQVEVDLKATGERLEVKIVTSGQEAESVLRRTSGDLKEALLARTDRFRDVEVKVENRATAEEEDQGGNGRESSQGNGRQSGRPFDDFKDPDSGPEQEG